jgi:hypothetical protein
VLLGISRPASEANCQPPQLVLAEEPRAERGWELPAERVAQQARGLPAAQALERVEQLLLVLRVERAELRVGQSAHKLGAGRLRAESSRRLCPSAVGRHARAARVRAAPERCG